MFSGNFAPVSAVFVGLAFTTSRLGRTSRIGLSREWAHRFVFLFMLCGTVTLAL